MEDKPLTDSINKQYSKYGSLRSKSQTESRIELCNAEDPAKFLTRIDFQIKDTKEKVAGMVSRSTIGIDLEYSLDQLPNGQDIPMVKIEKSKLTNDNNILPNSSSSSS